MAYVSYCCRGAEGPLRPNMEGCCRLLSRPLGHSQLAPCGPSAMLAVASTPIAAGDEVVKVAEYA